MFCCSGDSDHSDAGELAQENNHRRHDHEARGRRGQSRGRSSKTSGSDNDIESKNYTKQDMTLANNHGKHSSKKKSSPLLASMGAGASPPQSRHTENQSQQQQLNGANKGSRKQVKYEEKRGSGAEVRDVEDDAKAAQQINEKEKLLTSIYNGDTDTSTGNSSTCPQNKNSSPTAQISSLGQNHNPQHSQPIQHQLTDETSPQNLEGSEDSNLLHNTIGDSTETAPVHGTEEDEEEEEYLDLTALQPDQYHAQGYTTLLPPKNSNLKNKKCLILDLDETLVHSSFKYLKTADFVLPVEIDDQVHNVYVIKRPGVDEFLQKVGKLYEVVVFTASVSRYGNPLLDTLDIHKVIDHRLFREACYNYDGNYIKNLSQIGRPLSELIILDNSPASYIFHPQHAIPISSWFSDNHDNELLDILPLLEDLAVDSTLDMGKILDVTI